MTKLVQVMLDARVLDTRIAYFHRWMHTEHGYDESEVREEKQNIKKEATRLRQIVESDPDMRAELKTLLIEHHTTDDGHLFSGPLMIRYGATFYSNYAAALMTLNFVRNGDTVALNDIMRNDTLRRNNRTEIFPWVMHVYQNVFPDDVCSKWWAWLLSFDEPSHRALTIRERRQELLNHVSAACRLIIEEGFMKYDEWIKRTTGLEVVVCAFGGEEWTAGSWRIAQFLIHFKKT